MKTIKVKPQILYMQYFLIYLKKFLITKNTKKQKMKTRNKHKIQVKLQEKNLNKNYLQQNNNLKKTKN